MLEKTYHNNPWILAMVVQKTICWPNLGIGLQYATARAASTVRQAQAAAAARSTSTAAAVCTIGPSFPVSAMLLIYTYSLLPARALSARSSTSQRNHAAGRVSFGWSALVRQYSAPNVVGARKLKALIFYKINPPLYEKRSLCVFEPPLAGLRDNVCCSS